MLLPTGWIMGDDVRAGLRLSIVAVASLLGLLAGTIPALPQPPGGSEFPLTVVWRSMLASLPAWGIDRPATPQQGRGGPVEREHAVDTHATRANGGNGKPMPRVPGALGETNVPEQARRSQWTTPASGFNPNTSELLTSESTFTSDIFRNADGSFTRRIYSGPVNYRSADGAWRKIDNGLVRGADGRWRNAANSILVSVASFNVAPGGPRASADATEAGEAAAIGGSTDVASVTLPSGESISYRLQGATMSPPVISGSEATYQGVLANTDLRLYAFESGLKGTIVLNTAAAANVWVFPLQLNGLTPRLEPDGSVALVGAEGAKLASIPRGYMEDSKVDPVSGDGAHSQAISYELVTVDGGPALKVTADRTWLDDPAREYPVKVDPTAVTSSASTFAYSGWTGDNSWRPEVRIGNFNGTNAMGLLKFDSFSTTFLGAHITNVWLYMHVMWTGACPSSRGTQVFVNDVAAWTPSGVTSWSGRPALWGQMMNGVGYPDSSVCSNTSSDPNKGAWWSFAMNTPEGWTTLNRWTSPGGINNGIALTSAPAAGGVNNDSWMKISSANTSYKPYLAVNYSPNAAPVVNAQYPSTGYGSPTLTPEYIVSANDPDNGPNPLTYRFRTYDTTSMSTPVDDSGALSTRSYTVPSGKLSWGNTYVWTVEVSDGAATGNMSATWNMLSTSVPQPLITSSLSQNSGRGFEPSIGNYTTATTDAQVASVGPPLAVQRSYNSRDPRTGSAFGSGWSSILDAKVTEVKDAQGNVVIVVMQLPTGKEVAFAKRADGTFANGTGRYANFTELPDNTGYQLLDKDSTKFLFNKVISTGFGLESITDSNGLKLTLGYTGSQVTSLISASGRKLTFAWTASGTPHVVSVSTERADSGDPASVSTWTYTYTGDKLTKVCPPSSSTACTAYNYDTGSLYPTAVLDAGPHTYLRLNETSGTTAANSATDSVDAAAGASANVGLGQTTGPLAGLDNPTPPNVAVKAADFNGVTSRIELTGKMAFASSYQSVSLWFKTTVKGGVLVGHSQDSITVGTTAAAYTPTLYVGDTDGKLYGLFANGSTTPLTGPVVTDGGWHYVVLAASGTSQALYVDGQPYGTASGAIAPVGSGNGGHLYLGAGYSGGNWPQQPNPGSSNGVAQYFTGSISDFAFFTRPLTSAQAAFLHEVGRTVATPLTQITRPSGGIAAKVEYDFPTGVVSKVTDGNNGVWTINKPSVGSSSAAYIATVLGGAPADYFRLKDVGTTVVSNEVNGNAATYSTVTQGLAGPFSDTTASGFNGESSFVRLPAQDAKPNGANSVSMWFRTPAGSMTGGVLYSYQNTDVTDTSATYHVPAIYVGSDGRLRAQFWNGTMAPIAAGFVNDGQWHHVALTATTNSQWLYVDGQLINQTPLVGNLSSSPGTHAFIGAGKWASWTGSTTSPVGYFKGEIVDFAFYNSMLTSGQVAAQYGARIRTAMWLGLDRGTGGGALDPVPGKLGDQCSDASLIFAAGDLTGDGKQDVICRASNMYLYLYRGDGAGGFVGGGLLMAPGQEWRWDGLNAIFGAGDFDGDGISDVIARGTDAYLYLYPGDGSGGWLNCCIQISYGWDIFDALWSPGDFDGDGKPDVMARKPDGTLMLYQGNGAGGWKGWITLATGQLNRDAVPVRGDFDGDGKADYLYRDRTDSKIYMLRGNGTGGFISMTPAAISPPMQDQDLIFSPGDFTGDGKADILFRSTIDPSNPGAGNGVAARTIKVTDPAGKDLTYVYDLANGGRLVAQSDARGKTTRFGYDAAGFLRTTTDPNGNVAIEEHDVRGNVIARITCQDLSANTCSTKYFTYYPDATTKNLTPDWRNDKMLTSKDPNGFVTSYFYEAAGAYTEITDPLGRKTKTEYTDGTSIAAADGGFAPKGLPWRVTAPGGATQTTTYFRSGSVATLTDAAGLVTSHTYDGLGRVVTMTAVSDTYPSGLTTKLTYDKDGLVRTVEDPPVLNHVLGNTHTRKITNVYNADAQLTSSTAEDISGGKKPDAPRTIRQDYNAFGQLVSTTDPMGKSVTYTYDLFGRKLTETDRLGVTIQYKYDDAGNLELTKLTNWTGDPNYPIAPTSKDIESRSYDPANRLESVTDAMGWQTLYKYFDDNSVATVTRKDPSSGKTYQVESNVYDAVGNLKKRTTNNGVTVEDIVVDPVNRPATRTLDPTGVNRTTTYTYGADDTVVTVKMADASGAASYLDYAYDVAGRQISRSIRVPGTGEPDSWWKLDDAYGSSARDSSPAARNGTLSGGTTWADGAAAFDTTGDITTQGPVLDTTQSFTISAWAKVPSGAPGGTFVGQDGGFRSGFEMYYGGQWSAVKPYGDGNWGGCWLDSGVLPVADKWTHVTLVFDTNAGNKATLYVDGENKASGTGCGGFQATGAFTIGRGKYESTPGSRFKGGIDNVQAYKRALTPAEVASLFAKGRNGGALGANPTVSQDLDQRGLPKSQTDPNGNVTTFIYDEAGRLARVTLPAVMAEENGGAPVSTTPSALTGYNTFGEQTDSEDPKGRKTEAIRNLNGLVTSQELPSYTPPGGVAMTPIITTSYDDGGRMIEQQDPLGNKTTLVYDQLGRVARQTNPDLSYSMFTYDLLGNQLSTTGPVKSTDSPPFGPRVEATYDYLGRTVTSTQLERFPTAQQFRTDYSYLDGANQAGWLASVTPPLGSGPSYAYNNAGETTSVTLGGNTTSYTYDFAGRVVTATAPDGSKQTVVYDAAGRPVTKKQLEAGTGNVLAQVSASYDASGQMVTATDARGTTTTYTYDPRGALTQAVQPLSATDSIVNTFGYDAAGSRTRHTDGRGSRFITRYNSLGLPEDVEEPATGAYSNPTDRIFTTVYDKAGRPTELRSPGGVTATYVYDVMGRLISVAGAGAEVSTTTKTYEYDTAGRVTNVSGTGGTNTLTYDDRGHPLTVNGPSGNSSFAWDGNGRMASRTDAAGTTSYTYDGIGRLDTISNATAALNNKYSYNNLSQVTQITYGSNGNRRLFGYDSSHRLITDELKTSGDASIGKITYGWDLNNNETSKVTTGFSGSASNTYTYDFANRLTSWNNGTTNTAYAHDKSGNRTQVGAKIFTYDERNHLVSANDGTTYQYTARGTLKNTRVGTVDMPTQADALNQITRQYSSATSYVDYTYDGFGRAIKPGFAYTGTGNTLAGDGTSTYVRDPGGDLVGTKTGGSSVYSWTDLHSDVVGQFTAAGTSLAASTSYEPFGKVAASSGMAGNLGFQSEFAESSTKRVNMHSRWYNSETGQFDSRDTFGVPNRFNYVDNNPLTNVDPTGHMANWKERDWTPGGYRSTAWGDWQAKRSWDRAAAHKRYVEEQYRKRMATLLAALPDCQKQGKKVQGRPIDEPEGCAGAMKSCGVASAGGNRYERYEDSQVKTLKNCTTVEWLGDGGCVINGLRMTKDDAACQDPGMVAKQLDNFAGRIGGYMPDGQAGSRAHLAAILIDQAVSGVAAQKTAEKKQACDADVWCRNADKIGAVVDVIVAVAVTATCTAITAGVGIVGCAMLGAGLGGFLGSVATSKAMGRDWDDPWLWNDAVMGGIQGAAMGAVLGVAGKALGAVGKFALSTKAGSALGESASSAMANIGGRIAATRAGQAATNFFRSSGGRCATGVTADLAGGLAGVAAAHSFDPATKVLKAGGEAVEIKDVEVGDKVLATDPATRETTAEPVTALHKNIDTDLVDVTTRGDRASSTATLHTTSHHPFWDASEGRWVNAVDLRPGKSTLVGPDGQSVTVESVRKVFGPKVMHDLTVARAHTYYVLADAIPVLVHNCGEQHIALGLESDGLDAFARKHGAETLMNDPDWRGTAWTAANLLKYENPGFRVSFSLDGMAGAETGVASTVNQSLLRNARQIGGATDLELAFFYDAGTLGKVDFYIGGVKQVNPWAS